MSEATSDYTAAPLEENLFEWHFTVRGPEDSDFQVRKIFQPRERENILPSGRHLPRQDHRACRISHEASGHHSAHGTKLKSQIPESNLEYLQPNGRFEVGKKICLSISGHHPETWQPSWSIRTALLAIIAFMPSPGQGTIGSLDYSPEERRILARRSRAWSCPLCGNIAGALLEPTQVTFHPNTPGI